MSLKNGEHKWRSKLNPCHAVFCLSPSEQAIEHEQVNLNFEFTIRGRNQSLQSISDDRKVTEIIILTRHCWGTEIFLLLFLLDRPDLSGSVLELSIFEASSSNIRRCSLSRASIASLRRTFSATTLSSKTTYWSSIMKSAVYHESGHELKQEASELTKGRATQEKGLLSCHADKNCRQSEPPNPRHKWWFLIGFCYKDSAWLVGGLSRCHADNTPLWHGTMEQNLAPDEWSLRTCIFCRERECISLENVFPSEKTN